MSNSIRSDFHTDLAQTVLQDIQYRRSNYFYFLGKVESWGAPDLSPELVQADSALENTLIRSNSLYIKRISPNDVTLVAKRYDWTTGTVYTKWDNTLNVQELAFYVVTDENNVYKCLDNFSGATSTVKPTGTSFYPVRYPDGYLWKYMYTIPSFKRSRFSSLNYIPVQTSLTDSFYNKGSIDAVTIENSGTGYVDSEMTTISVSGAVSGSGATGTIVVDGIGAITDVTITNGGTGYTAGANVTVPSITGSGAILQPVIVAGVITDFTIVSGGIGYSNGSPISVTVGGATVHPVISRVTGEFIDAIVTNPGAGYTGTVALNITQFPASGTGKYGNASAILNGIIYNGSLQRVTISDPGQNYPYDTATSIIVQGDGTGAAFTPVVSNGEIIDVIVENAGTGYTNVILTVDGAGTGAKLFGVVSASDFSSDQSIVEQTADPGRIYAIEVSNAGEFYTNSTVVTVSGDGTGCTAEAIIVSGGVHSIRVTNFGSGYTYATISITDPDRTYYLDDKTATAYAIFPPTGGHGKNATSELYGATLAINMSLRTDTIVNGLNQDFRQYGLIKNPSEIVSGKFYSGANSLIAYQIQFDNVTDLVKDEILLFGSIKFRVVDIDGTVVTLQQLGLVQTTPIGTFLAEVDSNRSYTSTSILTYPIVDKYSGKLLYASNENPFTFTEEQGITIKTFLKF